MSKALEIASERYAKGEISKQEFEEIKLSLGATSERPEALNVTASVPFPAASSTKENDFVLRKKGWFLWMLPVMFIIPFRITQPSVSEMGAGIQIVVWVAMGAGLIGAAKWIFGKDG